MSEIKRLHNEQQFLISECKRHIESNKLSLWGYKAELASLALQYKKTKQSLEELEKSHFHISREIATYTRQMRYLEEVISRNTYEDLLELSSPYPLLQDIGTAICIIIGSMSPSWNTFRKLLKDINNFLEALKSFNPIYISSDQLKYFTSLYKKHNLALVLKDSKNPEELLAFINWFINCFLYTLKDQESRGLCNKIITTEKEAAETYLEIKEITENIKDGESKLARLMGCIEKAEKNISDLAECDEVEMDRIRRSCEKVENTVKKCSMPDSFLGEANGPSILVESLFIQSGSEFKFEDVGEASESKALISMEDMEGIAPKEVANQPPRIFTPKIRKSSKKKRCCGFG